MFGFDRWSWFLQVKVKQFGFNAHEFPRNTEPLPDIQEEGGIENELQVIYAIFLVQKVMGVRMMTQFKLK
jgi:hypothetical protein